MGFFRSSGLALVCLLFLLSVLALNTFLTLSTSLEYENVQPAVQNVVLDVFSSSLENASSVDDGISLVKDYCNDSGGGDFSFDFENYSIDFSCDNVENSTFQSFIDEPVSNFVETIYFKQYECEFWSCIGQGNLLVLISQKARDYWKTNMYYSLLASVILLVLMFFLVEKKKNFFVLSGSIIILSSFPFLKLGVFLNGLLSDNLYNLEDIFVSSSDNVFLGAFILGIVLVAIGIMWHFFSMGKSVSTAVNKLTSKKTGSKIKVETEEVKKKK